MNGSPYSHSFLPLTLKNVELLVSVSEGASRRVGEEEFSTSNFVHGWSKSTGLAPCNISDDLGNMPISNSEIISRSAEFDLIRPLTPPPTVPRERRGNVDSRFMLLVLLFTMIAFVVVSAPSNREEQIREIQRIYGARTSAAPLSMSKAFLTQPALLFSAVVR